MPKFRYLLAFTVMIIGFLPMFTTALLTSSYLTLTDYIFATAGFLLAVHITEWDYNKGANKGANDG